MNVNEIRWTLVARKLGGRFFRPIAGAPVGSWHEAQAAADVMGKELASVSSSFEIWYVPAEGEVKQELEDKSGNERILDLKGRWIPIRWDAEPQLTFPAPVVEEVEEVDSNNELEELSPIESKDYVLAAVEFFPTDTRLARLLYLVERRLEYRPELAAFLWVEAGIAAREIVQAIIEQRIEAKRIARAENAR